MLEESHGFLTQAWMRLYKGIKPSKPDVVLRLGHTELPAHRSLLAESSKFFEAMFQASLCMLECAVNMTSDTAQLASDANWESHAKDGASCLYAASVICWVDQK